ncbi:MAG: DUF4065 domain-containing protein [Bacilli bacterium]|nr:DUF4065 domain-containing protein [Bacilli bacterium]
MKNTKDYCLLCNKHVESIIINKQLKYEDNMIDVEYEGKIAICPICGEELYNDDVIKYNQQKIAEQYKIENDIITKEEIIEIMRKYNIGKRPLSLLLGFGEITITRYLDGYIPTSKNSKILKKVLYSPSDYYSILQMNKDKIKEVAFNKSEEATKKLLDINLKDGIIDVAAKYIVNKAEITNLSLQKILYYVQMFYMAIYKKHAFNSRCNAWEYGPVFGTIYHKYKRFGKNIIVDEMPENELDKDLKETIDNVLKYFGCYTGIVLKSFTHQETPWIDAIKSENKIIEKNVIREYGEMIVKKFSINHINEINKYSSFMFEQYLES